MLQSHGYTVREKEVLAVEIPDHPGALQAILKPLREAAINVLYLYTFLGRGANGQPIVIMGVDRTEDAVEVLTKNWVTTFGKEIYSL